CCQESPRATWTPLSPPHGARPRTLPARIPAHCVGLGRHPRARTRGRPRTGNLRGRVRGPGRARLPRHHREPRATDRAPALSHHVNDQRWPETPCLVVDRAVLEYNLRRFQTYCDEHGLRFRPHVKTHKTLEIAERQL